MKKIAIFLSILFSLMCTQTFSNDIAYNFTDDSWIVYYYGEPNICAPNNTTNLIKGTDCASGIIVRLNDPPNECYHLFTAPGTWDTFDVDCDTEPDDTTSVDFDGEVDSSPTCAVTPTTTIYQKITITFNN